MTATPHALLLTTDAEVVEINLGADGRARLAAMYALLRCTSVDVVALTSQWDMWIDDEGLYNHPVNPAASALARRFGFVHQPYHGPVLITGGADDEGDTLPLTRDSLRGLLATLGDLAH